jgi:hypothetical protein
VTHRGAGRALQDPIHHHASTHEQASFRDRTTRDRWELLSFSVVSDVRRVEPSRRHATVPMMAETGNGQLRRRAQARTARAGGSRPTGVARARRSRARIATVQLANARRPALSWSNVGFVRHNARAAGRFGKSWSLTVRPRAIAQLTSDRSASKHKPIVDRAAGNSRLRFRPRGMPGGDPRVATQDPARDAEFPRRHFFDQDNEP